MVAARGNFNLGSSLANSNQPQLYQSENPIIPVALGRQYQLTEMLHSGFGNAVPKYVDYVQGVRELYAWKKVNEMLQRTSNAVGRNVQYLDGVVSGLADGAGISTRHASRLGTNNPVIRDLFGAVSLYNPSTAQLEQIAQKSQMVRGVNQYNSVVNQYKTNNPGVSWLESVASNLNPTDPLRVTSSGILSKDIDAQTRFAPVEAKIYRVTDQAVTTDKSLKQAMLSAKQGYLTTLFYHYRGDEKAIKNAMGLQYSTTTVRTMMQRWQLNPDQMFATLNQYEALKEQFTRKENDPHQIKVQFEQPRPDTRIPIIKVKPVSNETQNPKPKIDNSRSVQATDSLTRVLLDNAVSNMRRGASIGENIGSTIARNRISLTKTKSGRKANASKLSSTNLMLN